MNPFSATYYLHQNKKRALALILLVASLVLVYLGGIYINTMKHSAVRSKQIYRDFATITPGYGCTQEDYDSTVSSIKNLSVVSTTVLVNMESYILTTNEMGTSQWIPLLLFTSKEDLLQYTNLLHLSFASDPTEKQLIISSSLSKNTQFQLGDQFDSKSHKINGLIDTYTVSSIVKNDFLFALSYDPNVEPTTTMALRQQTTNTSSDKEARSAFGKALLPYHSDSFVVVNCYESINANIEDELSIYRLIYGVLSILITLVLAITIVATFLGTYQKRNYEFSVYKALGISRKKILWKVLKEVCLIHLLGLFLCFLIGFLVSFFANQFYYHTLGLHLRYFEFQPFLQTLLCSLGILIPVILFRIRDLRKIGLPEES
ncbi:ABC transporter permease [Anaerosporobacter faecicola]|uniref:ABC transporter permease n=1 Tax=Anaerosporobacter faecicola TaxID=2718714 RepID=UPI00143A7324|nr:ABC transporter permease [Anaerosporobacter faecicola]